MLAVVSVFAALVLALVAAYIAVPDIREWLASPGGLIAWVATGILGIACVVALWALRRATEESRFRMLIPTVSAVLFLQSVRFGADLIGYRLPRIGEIETGSLVDLRGAVGELATSLGLGPTVGALVMTLLITVAGWIALRAWWWARSRVRVTETIVVAYLAAALTIHAMIPVMGFFGESTTAWFLTNVAALIGAAVLVVAGLASGDHRTTVAGWRRRMWAWLGDDQPLESGAAPIR
jgi:hypothetical protein